MPLPLALLLLLLQQQLLPSASACTSHADCSEGRRCYNDECVGPPPPTPAPGIGGSIDECWYHGDQCHDWCERNYKANSFCVNNACGTDACCRTEDEYTGASARATCLGKRDEMKEERLVGWLAFLGVHIILLLLLFILLFYLRKNCSGWNQLQAKYSNRDGTKPVSATLGSPRIFRLGTQGCCGNDWQHAQKFDRTMLVGVSPGYLHLQVTCCSCGMRRLRAHSTPRHGPCATACAAHALVCGCARRWRRSSGDTIKTATGICPCRSSAR